MELVVENSSGVVIGERDLAGSRWEQDGTVFLNLQSIAVPITVTGDFGDLYIRNGNERIAGEVNLRGRLDSGSSVIIGAGQLRLAWHEQHAQIWGRDEDKPAAQVQFARDAVDELRSRANAFAVLLARENPDLTTIRIAAEDVLSSIDDVIASLSVSGTPA